MMTQTLQIQDARPDYADRATSLDAIEGNRVLLSIDVYIDASMEFTEELVLSIDEAVKMRNWLDLFLMNRT